MCEARDLTRRSALAALVVAPAALLMQGAGGTLGQDSLVGRLPDPWQAGKPRDRVTDYENDPFIVGVEEKLRCTCGCNLSVYTCRTTDFTCETSPAMHRQVIALVEENKSAEEILQAFVGQYGETVLMAPPRRGFNLAGYLVPGILIVLTGGVLAWALARRSNPPVEAGVTKESDELAPADAARLVDELKRLEL
ncbi:MAG: hypothetical protein A2W29_00980 [Gemmatimonadetes bacterium RBG_16_66_8]|nr:MAG: hypothetical protein A2W29_00980 [Gemmatimonadetes bacterium RBG_16_66_8]